MRFGFHGFCFGSTNIAAKNHPFHEQSSIQPSQLALSLFVGCIGNLIEIDGFVEGVQASRDVLALGADITNNIQQ